MSIDSDLQLLIVEGNTPSRNAEMHASGGRAYSEVYRRVLQAIEPQATCRVLRPCEEALDEILKPIDLAAVDGVVLTGSTLNVYNSTRDVTRQVALFERLYAGGVPIFGSCWGLQVMATALGGRVRRNPLGREIGIARDVQLTAAGAEHPMYAGKPRLFDSIATHVDEVEYLPSGCSVLAKNAACAIQAAAIDDGQHSFWGVQYHPEFDLEELTRCLRRSDAALIGEGFFETPAELDAVCTSLLRIHSQSQAHLARRSVYGISDTVVDAAVRRLEIANWLGTVVGPRAAIRRG